MLDGSRACLCGGELLPQSAEDDLVGFGVVDLLSGSLNVLVTKNLFDDDKPYLCSSVNAEKRNSGAEPRIYAPGVLYNIRLGDVSGMFL